MTKPDPRIGARELALRALYRVDVTRAYADVVLDALLQRHHLAREEAALATELVYGTTRRLNTLDWILGRFLTRDIQRLTPWIRNILRLGTYQIVFLNRIPQSAAVFESVELAKRYGHEGTKGLVNAVLRKIGLSEIEYPSIESDPVAHITLKYSFPAWMVEKLISVLGVEGARAFCEASNLPRPITIRVNPLRTSKELLANLLRQEGIGIEDGVYCDEALSVKGGLVLRDCELFRKGLFSVQDEASMMVAHVVDPRKDEFIVDACSGPGTKTAHLAELMGNTGTILALDVHAGRLALVDEGCERLGITVVRMKTADARNISIADLGGRLADRVLVDAPCSGLGVLGKRPDARWRMEPTKPSQMHLLQVEILKSCARLVRPGGVLVYSTCTILPEENIEVIRDFMQTNPEFKPDGIGPYLHESLRSCIKDEGGWIQLYPHTHGTDGFFISRLKNMAKI